MFWTLIEFNAVLNTVETLALRSNGEIACPLIKKINILNFTVLSDSSNTVCVNLSAQLPKSKRST